MEGREGKGGEEKHRLGLTALDERLIEAKAPKPTLETVPGALRNRPSRGPKSFKVSARRGRWLRRGERTVVPKIGELGPYGPKRCLRGELKLSQVQPIKQTSCEPKRRGP